MAQPETFPEANMTWRGWAATPSSPRVGDLHVYSDPERQLSISQWALEPHERREVLATGRVWLHLWGLQPPVAVSGDNPFNGEPATPNLAEKARDTWDAFQGVGGALAMYESTAFDNPSQAFYAGQVWALNYVLHTMGLPTWPETDYASLDLATADYV